LELADDALVVDDEPHAATPSVSAANAPVRALRRNRDDKSGIGTSFQ
jgi:hypothetical protein